MPAQKKGSQSQDPAKTDQQCQQELMVPSFNALSPFSSHACQRSRRQSERGRGRRQFAQSRGDITERGKPLSTFLASAQMSIQSCLFVWFQSAGRRQCQQAANFVVFAHVVIPSLSSSVSIIRSSSSARRSRDFTVERGMRRMSAISSSFRSSSKRR